MDLSTLTDEEFYEHKANVQAEHERRKILANAPLQAVETNLAYLWAEGVEPGQEWQQPTGAHDAYPKNWVTEHESKTWVSLIDGNVWEPGVSGWREEVPEEDGYPEWIQPTGAHDAYNTGDRVSFDGADYESQIDGNTWSPTDYPAGWLLIEP